MAKIILITSGLNGILNAGFELVKRLEVAGHHVIYASPRDVGDKVSSQGIEYIQLNSLNTNPFPGFPTKMDTSSSFSKWCYAFKHRKTLTEKALNSMQGEDFLKMFRNEKPELLLIDIELHEYILKSMINEMPFILISQWFSLWPSKNMPYLLYDVEPGKGLKGSTWAINFQWKWAIWVRKWIFFKQKIKYVGIDRRTLLLKIAAKSSKIKPYIKNNYWPGPISYEGLPVLSMTASELEFPSVLPTYLTYIGPMVSKSRKEIEMDLSEKEIFESIMRNPIKTAKLIICTVSTLSSGDFAFLKNLISAVKEKKEWFVMISTGRLGIKYFDDLPSNVYAFTRFPMLRALNNADLCINHGGIHTIHECIEFGVPMLIYSGKKSDQNGCMNRMVYHGLAHKGDKDTDFPYDVSSRISKAIKDKELKKNLKQFKQILKAYRSNKILEIEITNYLLGKSKPF